MRHWILACIVLVFITAAACGGGSSTAPTPPPPSAPTLSTTTDLVFIGQVVTFAATGTGPITWGGDAPTIATVDSGTGRVTGVGTGRVTIWAENAGGRSTRLLRVLPSYNGNWSGSYTLIGCQSTGGFALGGFCGSFFSGQVLNMGFQISQTRDNVTGTFSLGSLQGTLSSGVVNEDGSLPLSGSLTSGTSTVQLTNLRATSPNAGTMKGSFDQVWGSSVLTGTGRLVCDIRDVTRTSGAPTLASRISTTEPLLLEALIRGALSRF